MSGPVAAARVLLINPNSSEHTTRAMVEIAQDSAREGAGRLSIDGITMTDVPAIITTPEALDAAAQAVAKTLVQDVYAAIIVAAFGDPGLGALRQLLSMPAIGIAEASMREAAKAGRPFGIATTTPALHARIEARVDALGLRNSFVSVRFTDGDPFAVMGDVARLEAALAEAIEACTADGAQAVIIGGGPLALAARRLKHRVAVPLIEPIVSAVSAVERALAERR